MRTVHWVHNPAIASLSGAWSFFRVINKNCARPLHVVHIILQILFYSVAFGFLAYIFYFGFPLPLLITWFATVVIALRFPRIFMGLSVFLLILIALGLFAYIMGYIIDGFTRGEF